MELLILVEREQKICLMKYINKGKIDKIKILAILVILLILKIIMVEVQPLNAKYTMKYDDQLMVEMSENIVNGNWLGEYNSKTLIKGVFTPLFISLLYILHIPFLIGKEIFYGISCIIFIMILRKKIENKVLLTLIYVIILFNPVEYSEELSRVYRDGIYISLIMYLIAFSLGIFFSRKEEISKQIKYFVGFGISMSAIFLCREENIWLIPFILVIATSTIGSILIDKKLKNKIKRIAIYVLPISIMLISINIVCMLNYKYYGVYTLNQYWGTSFKSAYGALTRVTPEEEKRRVPVNNKTIEELYKYSPNLSELKEFFQNEADGWRECGEKIEGEINGGYFHWALMDAVESKGYYKNAKMSDEYYTELAKEINSICDNNIVESRCKKRVSNMCYFDFGDIINVIKSMNKTIQYQYELEDVEVVVSNNSHKLGIENEEEKKQQMEKMTNQKIVTVSHYAEKWNNIQLKFLETINGIYKIWNKYLFYISIIFFIIFFLLNIKNIKEVYEELVIIISLFILYLSRIFVVTFTKEMMFEEALNTSYLACIYDIQYLFGIISIIFLVTNIKNRNKNKVNKDESYYRKIFSNLKDWVNRKKGEKI